MLSTQKSPTVVETLASYNILSVASESLTFYTQAGAVDSGQAIGTIVIGKLAKAPVLNLFGDRLGEFSGSAISTSISFTTGVLDSTLEYGFIYSGSLNERIAQTVAMLATKNNGAWACDYLTGLIIVKKKTTGTSQTINYKVRSSGESASISPVVESYTSLPINLAPGANQTIVAAPGAGKQIWIYGLQVTVNTAGTLSIQDEDNSPVSGIMPLEKGISIPPSGSMAMPIAKLATNKALEFDLNTSELDGMLQYGIVSE